MNTCDKCPLCSAYFRCIVPLTSSSLISNSELCDCCFGGLKENSIPCTQPAHLYFNILSDSIHECFMFRKMQFVRYGFQLSSSSIFLLSDFERDIEKLMGLAKYYYFAFAGNIY